MAREPVAAFRSLLPSFGNCDWREDLKSVQVPRLIIHVSEDSIPVAGAYAWAKSYPEGQAAGAVAIRPFPVNRTAGGIFRSSRELRGRRLAGERDTCARTTG
jgi:hypothetical protein